MQLDLDFYLLLWRREGRLTITHGQFADFATISN